MKDIKEILNILHSPHLIKEPVLGEGAGEKSLLKKLERVILSSQFSSDRDAVNILYGKIYDKRSFQILKSKLKKRAITTLLLCDFKAIDSSPYEAIRHQQLRSLCEANLLLQFGARSTAIDILNKVYSISTTHLMNDISIQAITYLRAHYWFIGDQKLYKRSTKKLMYLMNVVLKEHFAEGLYRDSTIAFADYKQYQEKAIRKIRRSFDRMKMLRNYISDSNLIRLYDFRIKITYYQSIGDNTKTIALCNKALEFINVNKILKSVSLLIYLLLTKCQVLIEIKHYQDALSVIHDLRKLMPGKNVNRIYVEHDAFICLVHLENYIEAEKIVAAILQNHDEYFFSKHANLGEWFLFKAYCEIANGRNFSTKIPKMSVDREGLNVSILICNICRQIVKKNFDELMRLDKIIDNYIYRHLHKKQIHKRTILFLKLLRMLIKADLSKPNLEMMKTAKCLSMLSSINYAQESEVIPYEKLWEMLMERI